MRNWLALGAIVITALLLSSDDITPGPKRNDCLPFDEHTRQVLITALDTALQRHVGTLFDVLMKDDRGQPDRAIAGVRNALTRHKNAITALDKPVC